MRWNVKPIEPTPKYGDTRIVPKFAWLPKRIGDEYVWLEVYYAKEVWQLTTGWGVPFPFYDWVEE